MPTSFQKSQEFYFILPQLIHQKKFFTTGFNIYRCGSLTVLLLSTATLQHTLLYSFTDISFFDFRKRSELLFKMIIFRIEFEIIFFLFTQRSFTVLSAHIVHIFFLCYLEFGYENEHKETEDKFIF